MWPWLCAAPPALIAADTNAADDAAHAGLQRDQHELMADIFNYFDRQTEARFSGSLHSRWKTG